VTNEKIPPHSQEREQVLIGGIFNKPSTIDDAREIVMPEDFYREVYREIYRSLCILDDAGAPLDMFSVTEELRRRGKLGLVDGPLLGDLAALGLPSQVISCARIVRGFAEVREIEMSTRIANRECFEFKPLDGSEFEDFKDRIEQKVFEACETRPDSKFKSLAALADPARNRFAQYAQHVPIPGVVKSGFTSFDLITGGLIPETLIVIGARPSMGKTALALQIAIAAAEAGQAVGFISLEMSEDEIMERAACVVGQANLMKARAGNLNDYEAERVSAALDRLSKLPIFIDDAPEQGLATIRAKARRLARRNGLQLLVIDYLQLIKPRDQKDQRERQVAEFSRGLKKLAKEIRVPVLVTAQLNRQSESRANHAPQLSDLRESGAIEADADVIGLLHRPEFYNRDDRPGEADLIIAKQRNGPRSTIPMKFNATYTRFEE